MVKILTLLVKSVMSMSKVSCSFRIFGVSHIYNEAGLQSGGVGAMVKHFTAFATPEQGLNTGPVHGGERLLRTTYLPSFHRQIIDAEATSIMTSYNSYDGVAVVASKFLLTGILRDEWDYKYFTMSDAGATDRLCNAFKMCEEKPIDKVAVTNYVSTTLTVLRFVN